MSNKKKEPSGCGCANIPISVILLAIGGSYWWFTHQGHLYISQLLPDKLPIAIPGLGRTSSSPPITPIPTLPSSPIVKPNNQPASPEKITPQVTISNKTSKTSQIPQAKTSYKTPWEKKSNQRNLFESLSSN